MAADQAQVEAFLDWLISYGDPVMSRTRPTVPQIIDRAREVKGVPKPCGEMEGMTGIRCFLAADHADAHEGWTGEPYDVAMSWPVTARPSRVVAE